MRYILISILLFLFTVTQATVYHVTTTGSDATGNGSSDHPWATVAKATSMVSGFGDSIRIHAGTYAISDICGVRVGVSVYGDGMDQTILTSASAATYFRIFNLYSSTQGTNGAQSISHMTLRGGLQSWMAIYISQRSNVKIHHVKIFEFDSYGIMFKGRDSNGAPSVYATGNELHDCQIINCAKDEYNTTYNAWFATGLLGIGGQGGMLIYDNVIDGVTGGRHGYGIKTPSDGYNYGIKLYGNVLKVNYSRGTSGSWDFALEFWNTQGGIEMYNNEIEGGLDFGGTYTNDIRGYGYAVKIYENEFGREVLSDISEVAFTIESTQSGGFYVYKNLIKNMSSPIRHYQTAGSSVSDIYFYTNIFYNIRKNVSGYTGGLAAYGATADCNYTNIGYYNNTIYNPTPSMSYTIKGEDPQCHFINFEVTNNIFVGSQYPVIFRSVDIGTLKVENNLYHDCITTTPYFYNCTPDTYVHQDNIIGNPYFVGGNPYSFALQSISSAIDRGKTPSLITDEDYTGAARPEGSAIDIGAYEYYPDDPAVNPTIVTTVKPYWTSATTAISGGYVTDDGGGTVSARGVCWSTTSYPTISDSHTSNGSGTRAFTAFLTGLDNKRMYYVRAYATNEAGTSYGNQLTFVNSQMIQNDEIIVVVNIDGEIKPIQISK